jgi:hypothetical protein
VRLVTLLDELMKEGRPTRIHAHHCAHCPSVAMPDDPETADIKANATREQQIESVFRCAWRRDKACKGYCDKLGIEDADLAATETIA